MSSHHFVREGQEPALIIADPVPFDVVAGLLEWAPRVVVLGRALETVLSWGIKVDAAFIANNEFQAVNELITNTFPLDVKVCPEGESTLAAAVNIEQGGGLVNVATADAGALIASLQAGPAALSRVVFFESGSRWTFHCRTFQKWLPAGARIGILKTAVGQDVVVSGAVGENAEFRAEADGIVTFDSGSPFWVIELQI